MIYLLIYLNQKGLVYQYSLSKMRKQEFSRLFSHGSGSKKKQWLSEHLCPAQISSNQ